MQKNATTVLVQMARALPTCHDRFDRMDRLLVDRVLDPIDKALLQHGRDTDGFILAHQQRRI